MNNYKMDDDKFDDEQTDDYSDIINLPHHVSTTYLPMPIDVRVAHFAPFSALTGLDAALDETAEQKKLDQEIMDEWLAEFYARIDALDESAQQKYAAKTTFIDAASVDGLMLFMTLQSYKI